MRKVFDRRSGAEVTSQGQVTIPRQIRDHLEIVPGDVVAFELAPDGRVVPVKAGPVRSVGRFEALRGRAGQGLSTDEVMALTRGEDWV